MSAHECSQFEPILNQIVGSLVDIEPAPDRNRMGEPSDKDPRRLSTDPHRS